jgi:hypothetical protein
MNQGSSKRLHSAGSLAAFKPIRLYRSEKGIWRYDIERNGKTYYASLHTRDETKARATYDRMQKTLAKWAEEDARL